MSPEGVSLKTLQDMNKSYRSDVQTCRVGHRGPANSDKVTYVGLAAWLCIGSNHALEYFTPFSMTIT